MFSAKYFKVSSVWIVLAVRPVWRLGGEERLINNSVPSLGGGSELLLWSPCHDIENIRQGNNHQRTLTRLSTDVMRTARADTGNTNSDLTARNIILLTKQTNPPRLSVNMWPSRAWVSVCTFTGCTLSVGRGQLSCPISKQNKTL